MINNQKQVIFQNGTTLEETRTDNGDRIYTQTTVNEKCIPAQNGKKPSSRSYIRLYNGDIRLPNGTEFSVKKKSTHRFLFREILKITDPENIEFLCRAKTNKIQKQLMSECNNKLSDAEKEKQNLRIIFAQQKETLENEKQKWKQFSIVISVLFILVILYLIYVLLYRSNQK